MSCNSLLVSPLLVTTLFTTFHSGSEVTQSYCPLNWPLEERQKQCREVYGFSCNCPRCQTEVIEMQGGGGRVDSESDDDDSMGSGSHEGSMGSGEGGTGAGAADIADLLDLPPNPDEGPLDPTYLQVLNSSRCL